MSLEDIIERAERCRDVPALMEVIDECERVIDAEHGKPSELYTLAYLWYRHPQRREDRSIQEKVRSLLLRVLKERPADYLSLLYLGHNEYDIEDYSSALQYFDRARRIAPKTYVGLKSYEMIACCDVMSRGISAALDAFEAFVREAMDPGYDKEDIWPRELVSALEKRRLDGLSSSELARLKDAADRLDQAGRLNGWLGGIVRSLKLERT